MSQVMTAERLEAEELREYYEKQGKLKAYIKEFRIARHKTDEKLAALPSRFIPRWCKMLDAAGVPAYDARKIVEHDALSLGWSKRAVIESLPKHYKNPSMAALGSAGGRATAAAAAARRAPAAGGALASARPRGLAAADEETRLRVARSGGEARAEDVEGLSEAGRKGGNSVMKNYGPSYYSEIGSKAHEELEELFTGEFQVNPLEWDAKIAATMELGRLQGRNVVFALVDSKLVSLRLAGVPLPSNKTAEIE